MALCQKIVAGPGHQTSPKKKSPENHCLEAALAGKLRVGRAQAKGQRRMYCPG